MVSTENKIQMAAFPRAGTGERAKKAGLDAPARGPANGEAVR